MGLQFSIYSTLLQLFDAILLQYNNRQLINVIPERFGSSSSPLSRLHQVHVFLQQYLAGGQCRCAQHLARRDQGRGDKEAFGNQREGMFGADFRVSVQQVCMQISRRNPVLLAVFIVLIHIPVLLCPAIICSFSHTHHLDTQDNFITSRTTLRILFCLARTSPVSHIL